MKSKVQSKVLLSEDDLRLLRSHVIEKKIQQRALTYAGITHRIFHRAIFEGFPLEKRKHQKLMQFCRSVRASHSWE